MEGIACTVSGYERRTYMYIVRLSTILAYELCNAAVHRANAHKLLHIIFTHTQYACSHLHCT